MRELCRVFSVSDAIPISTQDIGSVEAPFVVQPTNTRLQGWEKYKISLEYGQKFRQKCK